MENLEKAIYSACKAFVATYEGETRSSVPPKPHYTAPAHPNTIGSFAPAEMVELVNGIPKCTIHDKWLTKGQYGYYCQTRETAPQYATEKGYCKAKFKE